MFGHYKDEVGSLKVVSTTCHSTAILAAYFAQCNRAAGDCFFLYGNVGAGKSHFCREYIRFALGREDMDVPSPTYVLHNEYNQRPGDGDGQSVGTDVHIHHYDLYRLQDKNQEEFARLDLKRSFETGVCLIEWPERLIGMGMVPPERLELHLSHVYEECADGNEEDSERLVDLRWFGGRWGRAVETLAGHVKERGSSLGLQIVS